MGSRVALDSSLNVSSRVDMDSRAGVEVSIACLGEGRLWDGEFEVG